MSRNVSTVRFLPVRDRVLVLFVTSFSSGVNYLKRYAYTSVFSSHYRLQILLILFVLLITCSASFFYYTLVYFLTSLPSMAVGISH